MNCLAFDVGGTTVKYGVIDRSYKVLKKDKIPTPETVSYTHLTLPTKA